MHERCFIPIAVAACLWGANATAQPLDLPVWKPGVSTLGAAAYRGDRLSIRLAPEAARVARAGRPARPAASRHASPVLGIASLDRVAAALGGATFEPEFRGEVPPADPAAPDFTAYYLVKLPPEADLGDALARFRSLREVRSASPIGVARTSGMALALDDSLVLATGGWWLSQPSGRDIGVAEAWPLTMGDTSVVVAILDTGVIPYHPDLGGTTAGSNGQMWVNWAERGGAPGVDDDGNGFVDDFSGWDFVDQNYGTLVTPGEDWDLEDGDPNDFVGHGTAVAGLIGAIANNAIGTAGAIPNVRLMAVRTGWSEIERQTGVIDMSYLAQAMRYATRMGADVVNVSVSTPNTVQLDDAVEEAIRSGVVVVTAAGNQGSPNSIGGLVGVITVTATDFNDVVPIWANRSALVDLAAPGAAVGTTSLRRVGTDSLGLRQGGYVPDANGTSYAAPLASGGAALVQARRHALGQGSLSSQEMEGVLRTTADDIAAQNPGKTGYGAGRLDVGRAIALSDRIASRMLGALAVGPSAVLPTATGSPWIACVTQDNRLHFLATPWLQTVATVVLDYPPAGGVAAADLGGGRGLGLFVPLASGAIAGFTGSGRRLPGWPVQGRPGLCAPALGDLDGDGLVEIVHAGLDGRLFAWNAEGQVKPGFPVTLGASAILEAPLALADLDGSPGLEIVAALQDGPVHAIRGDGSELEGWPAVIPPDSRSTAPVIVIAPSGPVVVVPSLDFVRGFGPSGAVAFKSPALDNWVRFDPAIGDLDGDGVDEIVLTSFSDIEVLTAGGESFGAGWPAGLACRGHPVIGQIDGVDGPEIVVPSHASLLALTRDAQTLPGFPPYAREAWHPTFRGAGSQTWLMAVGRTSPHVVGFGVESGPANAAPWPTERGNFARTGCRVGAPGMAEVAPDPVDDLAVTAAQDSSVTLSWTATGDDGPLGATDHWVIRIEEWPTSGTPALSPREWMVPGGMPSGTAASASLAPLEPGTRYRATLIAVDASGQRSLPSNQPIFLTTGGQPDLEGPGLAIGANPSGAPVRFYWRLADSGAPARAGVIRVHDVSGRLRATLRLPAQPSGIVAWDARDDQGRSLAAGLYFATLVRERVESRARLVLLPR